MQEIIFHPFTTTDTQLHIVSHNDTKKLEIPAGI